MTLLTVLTLDENLARQQKECDNQADSDDQPEVWETWQNLADIWQTHVLLTPSDYEATRLSVLNVPDIQLPTLQHPDLGEVLPCQGHQCRERHPTNIGCSMRGTTICVNRSKCGHRNAKGKWWRQESDAACITLALLPNDWMPPGVGSHLPGSPE